LRRRRFGELERAFLPATGRKQGGERGGRGEGAYHPRIMNETDFHLAVDGVLERIEAAVESHDELEVDLESGVLTLTCPGGTRIIVNRQAPNREIWVAARSGGFHFAFRDGAWRDTRSGDELFASLARLIEAQSGARVAFG
jgi:CyaY protein